MTPAEAARLGASAIEAFSAWEESLPVGVRRMFGGDRALLLCATLLVPHVRVRMPLPPDVRYGFTSTIPRGGAVTMPSDLGLAKWVAISSADLILAAAIVLAVDRLYELGRAEAVPEELRAAASVALMLGLEVKRVAEK